MFRVLPGKPGHAPVPHTVPPMGPGRGSMGCCGANSNRESGRTFYRPNHPPSLRIKAAVTKPTHTHPLPPQIKTVYTLFMAIIHRDVGDKSTQHKLTTISQFAADCILDGHWTLGNNWASHARTRNGRRNADRNVLWPL